MTWGICSIKSRCVRQWDQVILSHFCLIVSENTAKLSSEHFDVLTQSSENETKRPDPIVSCAIRCLNV